MLFSALGLVAFTANAGPSTPQPQTDFWEYGSWRVVAETIDTGEDLRRTCTALTGGDGTPTLSVEISNGDGGPPHTFPSVEVRESAIRGYPTRMQDGQPLYIRFDDEDSMDATVHGYLDEDGFAQAYFRFDHPDSQWVLLAMRRNHQLDAVVAHQPYATFFLDGFTAAYVKAMEQCGFSGAGVVD
ncbi:hypothetical protein [Shimia marina]|uniref:Invasion protein B, involved in pathogenesis n=1 Tax=Shimia marina TaxID=321267 RepID=A0A0N7LS41_9RHOB|nr:hypothetical protein [Shimia marina]CUH52564.1 hypothetical protein SHM7688_02011 [Shimia marina]SFE50110.1 hypothetical protein SAMN04488037_11064 [Shimia marina]